MTHTPASNQPLFRSCSSYTQGGWPPFQANRSHVQVCACFATLEARSTQKWTHRNDLSFVLSVASAHDRHGQQVSRRRLHREIHPLVVVPAQLRPRARNWNRFGSNNRRRISTHEQTSHLTLFFCIPTLPAEPLVGVVWFECFPSGSRPAESGTIFSTRHRPTHMGLGERAVSVVRKKRFRRHAFEWTQGTRSRGGTSRHI